MKLEDLLRDRTLKTWLNPDYVQAEVLFGARRAFRDGKPLESVQLQRFLKPAKARELRTMLSKARTHKRTVPDRHSYHEVHLPRKLSRFLRSPALQSLLRFIASADGRLKQAQVRLYGHRDYTLLHDLYREPPGTDVLLHIAPEWTPDWGGSTLYFRQGEESLRVNPVDNALTLVKRPRGIRRFTKYVNHGAERNGFFVVLGRF